MELEHYTSVVTQVPSWQDFHICSEGGVALENMVDFLKGC